MVQTLEIVKIPNPILKRALKKVKKFDRGLRLLIENMVQTLHQSDGIGLAANQVNQDLQLAVVEFIPTQDNPNNWPPLPLTILLNPKIIKKSPKLAVMEEGCLSVPGVQKTVARPNRIEIINHDISGHRYRLKAQGLLSRVCQHEIDHLNGILIIDHPSIETKSNDKHII